MAFRTIATPTGYWQGAHPRAGDRSARECLPVSCRSPKRASRRVPANHAQTNKSIGPAIFRLRTSSLQKLRAVEVRFPPTVVGSMAEVESDIASEELPGRDRALIDCRRRPAWRE